MVQIIVPITEFLNMYRLQLCTYYNYVHITNMYICTHCDHVTENHLNERMDYFMNKKLCLRRRLSGIRNTPVQSSCIWYGKKWIANLPECNNSSTSMYVTYTANLVTATLKMKMRKLYRYL
jgi:hypothetical protein